MYLDFDLFAVPEHKLKTEDLSGQGAAGILIAFAPGAQTENSLDYLQKILGAVKINMAEAAYTLPVMPRQQLQLNLSVLPQKLQYLFLFGIKPRQLGLHFVLPLYQPIKYNDVTYLIADSLSIIQEERQAGNNQKAAALWQALQQIFLKPA